MVVTALHVLSGILASFLIKDKLSKLSIIFGTYFPDLDILFIDILEPNIRAHRTFTHSIYSFLIPIVLGAFFKKKYLIYFGLGIFLHVFLDFLTGGIYLFYPFSEILVVGFNFKHYLISEYIADFIFIYVDTILLFLLSTIFKSLDIKRSIIILTFYLLFVYISFFVYVNSILLNLSFISIPLIIYFYRKGIYEVKITILSKRNKKYKKLYFIHRL